MKTSATERQAVAAATPATRQFEIDGIRGWACLSVLFFHVFLEMLGKVVPALHSPLTAVLFNGPYAVAIFFVLSGDALSTPFFAQHEDTRATARLALKRYFRLTMPIALSCLGVWAIMVSGLDFHQAAARALGIEAWIGEMLRFAPSLLRVLRYVFYGVYAEHSLGVSYNPMLWTMSLELVGSFIVFLLCFVWRSLRRPVLAVAVAAVGLLLLSSPYFLFLFGVLLAYARSRGVLQALRDRTGMRALSTLAVAAVWALVAVRGGDSHPWPLTMLLCAVLVLAIYLNTWAIAFFSTRLSRFLGQISFPLYLSHFWILIGPMSYLVLHPGALARLPAPAMYLAIGVLCALLSIAVAVVFEAVERRAMAWLDRTLKARVLIAAAPPPAR